MYVSLQCELDHDNEVCCVAIDSLATEVASGTVDGQLLSSFHQHGKSVIVFRFRDSMEGLRRTERL